MNNKLNWNKRTQPPSYVCATLGSEAFTTWSPAKHKWESRSCHFDFNTWATPIAVCPPFFRIYDLHDPVVLNKGIWLSSKFRVCGCVPQACALIINLAICESEGGYYMLSVLPTAIKLYRVICSHCATQLQRTDNNGIAQYSHWVQRLLTTQRTQIWPFRSQHQFWHRVGNNGPEWG